MTVNTDPKDLLKKFCDQDDQSAFNRFYRQQSGRLWRYLRVRGCNEEAAYDLVAEAFARFIRVICKDPASPVALLYRIAINLHIDSYRREMASPIIHDSEAQEISASPESPDSVNLQGQLVRFYLEKLPKDEQNLLLMRYWIGLTHKEIAGIVKIPEGTVRRQAAAAIKKIKALWQADET